MTPSTGAAKVYDVLAQTAAAEQTRTCFALLGNANMNWATRTADAGCRMKYVRHENCAVAAAMAYSGKSGEVGVATTTCGQGLTQAITAPPGAVRVSLPLVVFGGEAPLGKAWDNHGMDQGPVITASGAAYHALHSFARMPTQVRDAFAQAKRERRPVVIGVPFDLQNRDWRGPATLPAPSDSLLPLVGPIPPHPDDIARAAQRLTQARRIVIMAGLGATHAGTEAQELADKLDALLATGLPARGLFAGHRFSIGIVGGFSTDITCELLGQADVVIGVGCSLTQHNADSGKLFWRAHVIQIDTNPVVTSPGRTAAHSHIRVDAALSLSALTGAVPDSAPDWRTPDLANRIATTPPDSTPRQPEPGLHDPRDVVTALEQALPADWEMVNSSGHCSYYFAQMPSRPNAHFLTIREFRGNGIAFTMGIAAAQPGSATVLFDGDGSVQMHIQEIETMLRHNLDIMICVLNDGAFGSEIQKLRAEGLSDAGAVFGRTDIAAIARGFGATGHTVTDLTALAEIIPTAKGITLLDFPNSDQIASPVMQRAHPSPRKTL